MRTYLNRNSIKGFISFVLLFLIFILFISCSMLVFYKIDTSYKSAPTEKFTQANTSKQIALNNFSDYKSFSVQILIKSKNSDSYSVASGVVYSQDGYIITNDHIYKDLSEPQFLVQFSDGSYVDASFIGGDAATDIALLKTDSNSLTPAVFGNSDQINQGDEVFSIGNPACESLEFTLTKGIISSTKRRIVESDGYSTSLIQTDAAVNPGSSGGPLIDSSGNVIGITTSKVTEQGYDSIGFSVPSNTVLSVVNEIKKNGSVSGRGRIGISYSFIKKADKIMFTKENGLLITKIDVLSDFFQSGIDSGDVIKSINGVEVLEDFRFLDVIDRLKVNDDIELIVRKKDGSDITVKGKAIKSNNLNSFY